MIRKKIKISLDLKDIDKAIDEVGKFKIDFKAKVDRYRMRIAEEISRQASELFAASIVDDVVRGEPRKADVAVSVDQRGNISVVVANGKDAVWCEFGSGVYHNGPAGSSPNPYGNDLGFTIGSYGYGHGKQSAWGYYDEAGNLVITRGTPASMPMYHSAQIVLNKAIQIAREVFL